MKTYATLLRLTVLNRLAYFRAGSWKNENGGVSWRKLISLIALLLLCAAGLAFIIVVEWFMYRLLRTIHHPEILPTMALMVGTLGVLFMSFFYILSSLYFSKDSMWMSYLPIRSSTLLCAKLTEIWVGEAALNAAIMLPAFIMYGMHIGSDALFYVRAVLIALLSPLLPMAVIVLLSNVLVPLVKGARNSTVITAGASMLLVIAIVGLELTVLPRVPDDADMMWFAKLLLSSEGMLNAITASFPPIRWAIKGLTGNWGQLGLFVLTNVGLMALIVLLFGPVYLARCRALTEQTNTGRAVKLNEGSYRTSSPLRALIGLEWKSMTRSSVCMVQCLAGTLVFPMMIGLMLLGGSISEEFAEMGKAFNEMAAELSPLDMSLILAAVMGFVTFVSPAAPTAVTREGRRHAVVRTLPVKPLMVLRSKLLVSAAVDVLAVSLVTVILAIGLKLPWWTFAIALALIVLLRYACLTMMLTVDAVHPILHWTNETQAVKQNVNVMFGMLICIGAMALAGVAVYFTFNYGTIARFAGVAAVLVLEAVAGAVLLHKLAVPKYSALEG